MKLLISILLVLSFISLLLATDPPQWTKGQGCVDNLGHIYAIIL